MNLRKWLTILAVGAVLAWPLLGTSSVQAESGCHRTPVPPPAPGTTQSSNR